MEMLFFSKCFRCKTDFNTLYIFLLYYNCILDTKQVKKTLSPRLGLKMRLVLRSWVNITTSEGRLTFAAVEAFAGKEETRKAETDVKRTLPSFTITPCECVGSAA